MNLDLILAIIFYVLVIIFLIKKRKNVEVQGNIFFLYRTKLGLKLMDKIAGISPKTLKILGLLGIITGFLGMIIIFYFLVIGVINVFLVPEAPPALAPLLPGIKIVPGIPTLSFWYWIISIFVVASIHEFFHGIYARANKIKVQSSGFAFLGPIPAAFVEPDEKELSKKGRFAQISVFAAGPFANILLGVIIAIILFGVINVNTVQIADMGENSTLALSGMKVDDVLFEINTAKIDTAGDVVDSLKNVKPGDIVNFKTSSGNYDVVAEKNPKNNTKASFDFGVRNSFFNYHDKAVYLYGSFPKALSWIVNLLVWLFIITVGVGLFNLLPLGPIDGGRMLLSLLSRFTSNVGLVKKIWLSISFLCLLLILVNLLPFLISLFEFLFKPLINLV